MNTREYAYLGDAVWELYVREYILQTSLKPKDLHEKVTSRVKASFQHALLLELEPLLTQDEHELIRRARNLAIPIGRRNIQKDYRAATAFEALIGHLYVNDRTRLLKFEEMLTKYL